MHNRNTRETRTVEADAEPVPERPRFQRLAESLRTILAPYTLDREPHMQTAPDRWHPQQKMLFHSRGFCVGVFYFSFLKKHHPPQPFSLIYSMIVNYSVLDSSFFLSEIDGGGYHG
jgi:hypothetical protein